MSAKQSSVNPSVFYYLNRENKGFYMTDDLGNLFRITLLDYIRFWDGYGA